MANPFLDQETTQLVREDIPAKKIKRVVDSLVGLVAKETQNNLSPVFSTPIDQHAGIQIEGSFKTNDASTEGKMSYITVRRSADIAVPFDGYGIGWRKGDGSSYNIYIVDNDALNSDVFINEEQMWDQTGGTNQFLMAAAKEILVDTWYKYVIKIYDKNGIDVWIDEEASFPGTLTAANRTIYRGQTYPPYVTQSAGDHFGWGVIETANSEWWYKPVKITSIIETYPMQLFKLKCKEANFPTGDPFSLTYYGVGYGDTENRLKWYVRNQDTASWDLCGTITAGYDDTLNDMKSVKSLVSIDPYRDGSEFVSVLATPYNYNDDEHILRSHYVGATNTLLSGIHRGNMSDVYVNAKSRYKTETLSHVMTSPEVVLRTVDGIQMPIIDVVAVSRTLTGIEYTENIDYSVTRPDEGDAYSTRDDIKIVFEDAGIAGVSVNIQYRYYADGAEVQTLLESDDYRYVGTDNLLKVMPCSIIKLNTFEYKGDVLVEDMQTALATFINAIDDGDFEVTDLLNAAYNAGATYVSLATLDIDVKDHEFLGTYTNDSITNTYTITGLKTYFADTTSLYGVTKVG